MPLCRCKKHERKRVFVWQVAKIKQSLPQNKAQSLKFCHTDLFCHTLPFLVILSLWRSIHKIKVYFKILMDFSLVSLTQNDRWCGFFAAVTPCKPLGRLFYSLKMSKDLSKMSFNSPYFDFRWSFYTIMAQNLLLNEHLNLWVLLCLIDKMAHLCLRWQVNATILSKFSPSKKCRYSANLHYMFVSSPFL